MSKTVTIDCFKHLDTPDFFAPRHVEVVPPAPEEWTRSYVYPSRLIALGSVLASVERRFVRPVAVLFAKAVRHARESLYGGLVRALEITGFLPTGKAEFGLAGETLSEYKVRHIRERHALVLKLKQDPSGANRDGIITEINDITGVLERVGAVQAARKGW